MYKNLSHHLGDKKCFSLHHEMQQEYHFQHEYLIVNVKGKYAFEKAQSLFKEAIQKLKEKQTTKVLFDCREIQDLHNSPMISYSYGDYIAKEILQLNQYLKLAYLLHDKNIELRKFGKTVASNRGIDVKVFTEEADAILWLQNDDA
ncbi:STAS/SEC14 domain-containing protein [Sediminitomix flava]|uniref:SpoIIAA-like protein n=1 Tax=Sediminitomix flava TaxID=379075 RepID=A0A315ZC85_SEDFL|nr:STAS/SEC14 domain-containing protein [Sediminitomix flava]PWJ43185.1 SpoIIAA-like protein [Sediminitomix flava]